MKNLPLLSRKTTNPPGLPDLRDKVETTPDWLVAIHPALRLVMNKRARRVALRLDPDRRIVRLVAPPRISQKTLQNFALSHHGWVAEKLSALPVPVPYHDRTQLPLCGRDITLHINLDKTLKRTNISLKNNDIFISTYMDDVTGRLNRFFKRYALEHFTPLAQDKATRISRAITGLQVKDTKTRWGSCGHDGRICLSWRLIFAPPAAMDYVIAHEVAHLVHMDHSPYFWALCADLSDDFSTGKKWMKHHGHSLLAYGCSDDFSTRAA